MQTREQILTKIKEIMSELFELSQDEIQLTSTLNEDLGLDSIDAIDLISQLQNFVGQRIQPEEFRNVRTVEDIVDAAEKILKADPTTEDNAL